MAAPTKYSLTFLEAFRIKDWPAWLDECLDAFATLAQQALDDYNAEHPDDEPIKTYPVTYYMDDTRKQLRLAYAGDVEGLQTPVHHDFPCLEYVRHDLVLLAFKRLFERHPFLVFVYR